MAENSITGGQQRSFAKNISRQSALQIRQSATAAVKALTEQVGTTYVCVDATPPPPHSQATLVYTESGVA